MGGELCNWYVRSGGDVIGPLSEAAMRQMVMKSSDSSMFVRQGESEWHAADSIRQKIEALAANGIYVKSKGVAQGPFTFTKAYELILSTMNVGIEIRTGATGAWIPAEIWLSRVEELKRERDFKNEQRALDARLHAEPLPLDSPAKPDVALAKLRQTNGRSRRVSKRAKWVLGSLALIMCLASAGWYATDQYQHRHVSDRYLIVPTVDWPDPQPIETPTESAPAPVQVVKGQLFRPVFSREDGNAIVGTAFLAKVPERDGTLIVTACQLLDSIGGRVQEPATNRFADTMQLLTLRDCLTSEAVKNLRLDPIAIGKTASFPNVSRHGDVLVSQIAGIEPSGAPWVLSPYIPQRGDRVWLVAQVHHGQSLIHPAVVISIESDWIVYAFDNPDLELQATSGAPVVDESGKVIAIQVGGGSESGEKIGIGSPVEKFFDYLMSEL